MDEFSKEVNNHDLDTINYYVKLTKYSQQLKHPVHATPIYFSM